MPTMSQLDPGQVVKSVYDATNQAIQVNVVATAASGASVVKITDGSGSGNNVTVTSGDALLVDGSSVTQPISAVSLPLPTGAATSGNQTTANTSLSSIATSTGTLATNSPTLGQKTSAGSVPVVIASDQSTVPVTFSGSVTVVQPTGTNLHTVVDSSALPTGASTSANQTIANTSLSSIDSKTPALGQALAASSVPVVLPAAQITALTPPTTVTVIQPTGTNLHTVIDSGTVTLSGTSVISGTVTANQGSANATPWNENISQFGGTSVSLGSNVSASSIPVVIASDQSSLPLPTGAATSANQTNASQKTQIVDGSGNVIGSTSNALNVDVTQPLPAGTNNIGSITNITGTISLPTGAATSANQTSANTTLSTIATNTTGLNSTIAATGTAVPADALQIGVKNGSNLVPITQGSATSANSIPVVIASDQSAISQKISGYTVGQFVRNDYTVTGVTTSTYVQLIASTSNNYQEFEIFDSSGQTLEIAFGGSGSEVPQFLVFPGGNGRISNFVASGTRISIKAVSANASVGEIDINLRG